MTYDEQIRDLDRRACEAHAAGRRRIYKKLQQQMHDLACATYEARRIERESKS